MLHKLDCGKTFFFHLLLLKNVPSHHLSPFFFFFFLIGTAGIFGCRDSYFPKQSTIFKTKTKNPPKSNNKYKLQNSCGSLVWHFMEQTLAVHRLAFCKTKSPHSVANLIMQLHQLLLKLGPVYIGFEFY